MSEERKKLALDKIKMLEGKFPYNNMSNVCWGDGIFATSIIRDFGQEADTGSISGVKAWAEGKPKEKPVRTYPQAEARAMVAAALREAAGNFSEGWHDGISADCHTPNLRQMKDNILALIPTDHAAALDKQIEEAERRGMERERERILPGLAKAYAEDSALAVAHLCDQCIDPTGRLLGDVRKRAAAIRAAMNGGDDEQ